MGLEDIFFFLIYEGEGKFYSGLDIRVYFQEVFEYFKLKKYEKIRMFVDFESVIEIIKDFFEDKKVRILEGYLKVVKQIQQCKRMRIYE